MGGWVDRNVENLHFADDDWLRVYLPLKDKTGTEYRSYRRKLISSAIAEITRQAVKLR